MSANSSMNDSGGGAVNDSVVLEEEIDQNYVPSEAEVVEYSKWLGMDLEKDHGNLHTFYCHLQLFSISINIRPFLGRTRRPHGPFAKRMETLQNKGHWGHLLF